MTARLGFVTCVGLVFLVSATVSLDVSAQQKTDPKKTGMMLEWTPPSSADRDKNDLIVRGRAVAVGASIAGSEKLPTKPQACFTCHGLEGAGDPSGAFPRIAGQPAYYLYKQLVDYASGTRPNSIMSPIAKALTNADMEAAAAYYAAQDAADDRLLAKDTQQMQEGAALSAVGSAQRGIPACVNCHGPSASGLPPTVPYLAGQHAAYTRHQLREWKEGKRKNDPLGVMADIARRMNDDDIEAVSSYLARLPPPNASRASSEAKAGDDIGAFATGVARCGIRGNRREL